MDNLRAMREARYEQAAARAKKAPAAPPMVAPDEAPKETKRPAAKRVAAAKTEAPATSGAAAPEAALCGHRSMNGRTCTREHGHAAKNHRYS